MTTHFKPTIQKGRFSNDNGFILDFRFIINSGYYYKFEKAKEKALQNYLRDYQGAFVLEHWNKPEGKCGLWDSTSNRYVTLSLEEMKQPFTQLECYRVEIPYVDDIKPTYVIFYPNSILSERNLYDVIQLL